MDCRGRSRRDHLGRLVTFERWADEWFAGLRRPKENTKRVYRGSIDYGKRAFGAKQVRKIGAADIARLLDLVAHTSPASQRRHLRVLHGCFAVAVRRGYAARNPIADLEESAKPRSPERRPAYFTDSELTRLWPELAKREPVYLHLCRIALATGCRQGELLALKWGSVRLLDRELHVDDTYVQGIGLSATKGNEGRTVDLTPAAVGLFEAWLVACGNPGDDELVFPHPVTGGYLVGSSLTREVLYRAMADAGVPREGEHGRKRTFHSLRHSFARIALQHGARIDWVQRQLGHSTITLTVDTYGRWERRAEKEEAAKLAGVFPV